MVRSIGDNEVLPAGNGLAFDFITIALGPVFTVQAFGIGEGNLAVFSAAEDQGWVGIGIKGLIQ